MEVSEIIRLADWFNVHTADVQPKYQTLVGVLQNNAQQPTQQPVTEPFKDLSRTLAAMPTQELSSLQTRVLEELDVAELVGKPGKKWLNGKIKATTYDPATTFETIQKASQRLESAKQQLTQFKTSAASVGFTSGDQIDAPTPYVINVIFQGDAAIADVRDWKKTATDWEFIISGVAGLVDEKPEDVKIVGASNGSIIFTLSATPLITKILATISKHIASIANSYLDFQLKREELKRSAMYTEVMQKELDRLEGDRRAEAKALILDEVKALAADATPEAMAKLEKAIDRQITFGEKGGELDFVSPPSVDEDAEGYDEELAETIEEIRGLIEDYRTEAQQTQLLTKQEDGDEEDD